MYIISINGGKPIRVDKIEERTEDRIKFSRFWKDGTEEKFDIPLKDVSMSEIVGKSVKEYWEEQEEKKSKKQEEAF